MIKKSLVISFFLLVAAIVLAAVLVVIAEDDEDQAAAGRTEAGLVVAGQPVDGLRSVEYAPGPSASRAGIASIAATDAVSVPVTGASVREAWP